MKVKKHIPNLLTLGNLFCGTVASIFAVSGDYIPAAIFVVAGILFDFLDGFVARILKVSGELGKQLDSLADMVTSGVVPGIIMFNLLSDNGDFGFDVAQANSMLWLGAKWSPLQFLGLILTLGACYRLAKFNLDTRQSDSFIGLPTPAMSLFVVSLPIILEYSDVAFVQNLLSNPYILIVITLLLTYLMNAEIPLFSLKFKNYSFQKNWIIYVFLITSVVFILVFNSLSIPIIIILYVILSIFKNWRDKA